MDLILLLIVVPLVILIAAFFSISYYGLVPVVIFSFFGSVYYAWAMYMMQNVGKPNSSGRMILDKVDVFKDVAIAFVLLLLLFLMFHYIKAYFFN
ncbi:MAG: hypothetical protein DIZ80_06895 [endosymbiont of Galathealinum brachiosum]|uniref:Uncharacterized protein n=1 Tax=endosymbiont of Galathealinum brachiosum TaxID=2200906 RepID=A0A370DI64_9GAMM|nr:MAG: hypothetical protein DIZ80_06895 [endosymbiont of Galathealinum brachiosum]